MDAFLSKQEEGRKDDCKAKVAKSSTQEALVVHPSAGRWSTWEFTCPKKATPGEDATSVQRELAKKETRTKL